MLSFSMLLITSFPRKIPATSKKVRGISLRLKLVRDAKIMSMKAIPLAPIRLVENKTILRIPVIRAVISIIKKSVPEEYFSSTNGPTRRIIIKLLSR